MSSRKSKPLALLLAVCATSLPAVSRAQPPVGAQESPVTESLPTANTGMLTSQQAVELAVHNNPELHTALLQESQARFNVTAEEALFDPVFTANAGYTHSRNPSLRGTDGTVVSTSNVYNVSAGLTKQFAVGTVASATVTGQRSASASPPINN